MSCSGWWRWWWRRTRRLPRRSSSQSVSSVAAPFYSISRYLTPATIGRHSSRMCHVCLLDSEVKNKSRFILSDKELRVYCLYCVRKFVFDGHFSIFFVLYSSTCLPAFLLFLCTAFCVIQHLYDFSNNHNNLYFDWENLLSYIALSFVSRRAPAATTMTINSHHHSF